MSLTAGTKLGPYEIVSVIGAGGMGEVYRARDTRLDRDVAIKVLNSQLTASPELRARFEREAKVISQLQHPHICVLHDVGSENGTDYLVMEYLDGEVLSEKVKRGPLPVGELLKIAIDLADALTKAHKAGIIHRDLKPGNVMLTKSGAKLLDFGLAKPVAAAAASSANSGSASIFAAAATMTSPASPLSSAGTVIGTVQYMAPEQIQGQEADARSDVFAFGVVLYEMATGKRAFEGKTQSSIVGQILAVDPPAIASLQPTLPAALSRLVQTCLAKDPDERFQTIHDVKLRLQEIAEAPGKSPLTTSAPSTFSSRFWIAGVALLWIILAAALGLVFMSKTPTPQPTHFQVDLNGLQAVWQTSGSRIAISPDGRVVAMILHGDNVKPALYIRKLDEFQISPIPGTDGASQPFFSPDGRWLGFNVGGKIKKVEVSGGAPIVICDAPSRGATATWGDDGTIVFSDVFGGDLLFRVSSESGTPSKLDLGKDGGRWAVFLPGSRALLTTVRREGRFDIDVFNLDTMKSENVVRDGSWPRYIANGYVVYTQYSSGGDSAGFTGNLLAVPFDLKSLKRTGSPKAVMQEVQVGTGGAGFYDVSLNGTIAYMNGGPELSSAMEMMWLDPSGKTYSAGAPPFHIHNLRLSPDGKMAAFSFVNSTDVYTFDLARKTMLRLTFDKHSQGPIYSPDGKRIFYSSGASARQQIWSRPADGSGQPQQFTHTEFTAWPESISPDGNTLAYSQVTSNAATDISFASLHGDLNARPFLNSKADERDAEFSPDGKFIAYVSNESGDQQVYVRNVNGAGVWQISSSASRSPRWAKNGKKLFFITDGSQLMQTEIAVNGSTLSFTTPKLLFQTVDFLHGGFDVTPDGRFLWSRLSGGAANGLKQLRVIEHFDAEIAKKAAAPQ